MWRPAKVEDVPALAGFFSQHLESSMFLLGNLEAFGLDGTSDHACRYWVWDTPEQGVFARSQAGMVMMQAPDRSLADLRAAGDLIAGHTVSGVIGDAAQVARFVQAVDWPKTFMMDVDEPGYTLDLADLVVPPSAAEADLRPLAALDTALAENWRHGYVIELGMVAPHLARAQAVRDIAHYRARDTHRVLFIEDRPVAMTGFNSIAGDAVQIGGVWTPPELRGNGYARAAVALHLAEARATGTCQSVLFAASPIAARAYEAIGFRRCFDFGWRLYSDPIEVPA